MMTIINIAYGVLLSMVNGNGPASIPLLTRVMYRCRLLEGWIDVLGGRSHRFIRLGVMRPFGGVKNVT